MRIAEDRERWPPLHHVFSTLQHPKSDLRGCDLLDMVVIHAGGNDLGFFPSMHLTQWVRADLNSIRDLCPGL